MSNHRFDDTPLDPHQRFARLYSEGHMPWDSGISPPELLAAIQGPDALPPGLALDIGCGTGTNSVMMAKSGWQVLGIDFVAPAIAMAQAKADKEEALIVQAGGSVRFVQHDITQLAPPPQSQRFTLLLDIGCLNGIPYPRRAAYARIMAEQAAHGALFLLYAHLPSDDGQGPIGSTPDEVDALFGAAFLLKERHMGLAPQGGASMWNWLRRR